LLSLKALFDRCAFQHEPGRVSGKVAAFSAALPERYSARRGGGYYFPKIDENPWERRSVALQRRSEKMGIDPASIMPPDPVELVAGCRDAAEKPICSAMVEGSMSK